MLHVFMKVLVCVNIVECVCIYKITKKKKIKDNTNTYSLYMKIFNVVVLFATIFYLSFHYCYYCCCICIYIHTYTHILQLGYWRCDTHLKLFFFCCRTFSVFLCVFHKTLNVICSLWCEWMDGWLAKLQQKGHIFSLVSFLSILMLTTSCNYLFFFCFFCSSQQQQL